jgi:hypothetical protein
MPHISNPEREAARWIDVADLCTAICRGENSREADAVVQLRKALADGAFVFRRGDGRWDDGVRWGDGYEYGLSGSTDRGKWWLTAKIRFPGDGKVLDNHMGLPDDDVLTGKRPFRRISRYRTLLIYRDSASRIWRLPPAPSAPPAAKSKATPRLRKDLEAAYARRYAKHGYQTEKQDEAWRKQMDISRRRLREVRKPYVKAKLRRRETARSAANPRRTRAEPTPNRAEPAPNPRRGKS